MRVEFSGKTDKGCIRDANEDVWLADGETGLFLVSDGMGGAAAGEVAARMVKESIAARVVEAASQLRELGKESAALVRAMLTEVSRGITEYAQSRETLTGMGATLVMALVREDRYLLAHVGDSRCYRLNGSGKLETLTKDHSLVQHLLDAGEITAEDADCHPEQACLTQCMGMLGQVRPGVRIENAKAGQRLLLCSDGLHTMIDDERIGQILSEAGTVDKAARDLIDAANKAGGHDNITALVLAFAEG